MACRAVHPPPLQAPRWAQPGYAMPLAMGATGVLLLLSLTLHGMAMQERLQVGALERQGREEDLLASGAHQLLAALNGAHRCLLSLPLASWEGSGASCASPAAVATLRQQQVLAVPVRLVSWQPRADGQGAVLELALEAGAPADRSARRGRFAVRFAGAATPTGPGAGELGPRLLGGGLP